MGIIFLEPVNPKKEEMRSPRKVLGARKPQKRGDTVAKKGSWSPQTPKKRRYGRQERFLEPANSKKVEVRSPRKVLGARKLQKSEGAVAKKGSWSPQTPKKRRYGRQERLLERPHPQKEEIRTPGRASSFL
jgi:hypothetical protein